ncbi:hypothetical protein GDO81_023525 [Engystomops pustulosus]|uniref:Uncharacterized protein n=1 Tax=Engystomops pustulosus TaxID=76066 RepID=A0AAV6YVZ2_ENGPU|nr:hypothetical protein GDO81_023525 [Engystomops pustulosus]
MDNAYGSLPWLRFQEMCLQLWHRSYITPTRGYHMGIYDTTAAGGVTRREPTLYHCMWACSVIQPFWHTIIAFTNKYLTNYVPSDPLWAIFGYLDTET